MIQKTAIVLVQYRNNIDTLMDEFIYLVKDSPNLQRVYRRTKSVEFGYKQMSEDVILLVRFVPMDIVKFTANNYKIMYDETEFRHKMELYKKKPDIRIFVIEN